MLTQRFRPRAAPPSRHLASNLVALRGETEGLQVVVRAPDTQLRARLAATSSPLLLAHARIRRVEFVRIRRQSTGVGPRRGRYADPLLPLNASRLDARRGRWAG